MYGVWDREMVCSPPHRGQVWGGANFFFVISKWHILVNSEVLNLKFLFIVSSLGEVWAGFLTNFGFSSKAMNKRHH